MKRILLIGLLLMLNFYAHAQDIEKGDYLRNAHLDEFAGIWQGVMGTDTLTLSFAMHKVFFKGPGVYMDAILGGYKYVRNGVVIGDYLHMTGPTHDSSILIGNADDEHPCRLDISFWDPQSERSLDVTFKLNCGQRDRARAQFRFSRGLNLVDKGAPNKNRAHLPVPSTWQMKKVE
jgi:hypothetical protein